MTIEEFDNETLLRVLGEELDRLNEDEESDQDVFNSVLRLYEKAGGNYCTRGIE